MEFSQDKLSRTEWFSIEIPFADAERAVLQMIVDGYETSHLRVNDTPTLYSFTKIAPSPEMEMHIFETYFKPQIQAFLPPNHSLLKTAAKVKKLKHADQIRLNAIATNVTKNRAVIFEFVLIDWCAAMFANIAKMSVFDTNHENEIAIAKHVYTLVHTTRAFAISGINKHVLQFVDCAIAAGISALGGEEQCVVEYVLANAHRIVETNAALWKYADMQLHEHQKHLFRVFRQKQPSHRNFVLYTAPTGTGKTLSPLGLSVQYKIIFVCVARHVGLAFARAAIAVNKKIAFAFGCESPGDIRLHYFAAKEFTRNRKSGAIGKVDNSVGDKVEIIVCDVRSYLCAMRYMLAFHDESDIVTYWDEPTITLDEPDHELHSVISRNWKENEIGNMVLSSATLPRESDIEDVISGFCNRFSPNVKVYTISSHENRRSVSLVTKDGKIAMPHTLFFSDAELHDCVRHFQTNRVLLKYLDVQEISKFLSMHAANGGGGVSLLTVTMTFIKEYYLEILQRCTMQYSLTSSSSSSSVAAPPSILLSPFCTIARAAFGDGNCGVLLTTTDAKTVTDGPAIYMTDDVDKVSLFFLQQMQIPETVLTRLQRAIDSNGEIAARLQKLKRDFDDLTADEAQKERKMAQVDTRLSPAARALQQTIDELMSQFKTVSLDKVFVPNSRDHQMRYNAFETFNPRYFTSDLESSVVEKIVQLHGASSEQKLLLLMGVGVFAAGGEEKKEYLEIMKELAYAQKLFLIIASSDYIYGTNYNFCHGVLGRDLATMTQQKTIQALGRVGRSSSEHECTVRFRDDDLLRALFLPAEENLEAENMSRLFAF